MSGLRRRAHARFYGRGLEGALKTSAERAGTRLIIDNLSRGGLFARARFLLEPGASIFVELEHPVDRNRFTLRAIVANVLTPEQAQRKGVEAGFGVAFDGVGSDELEKLDALIAWLEAPQAYVPRPAAPAPEPARERSSFDFKFTELTDDQDFTWSGSANEAQPVEATPIVVGRMVTAEKQVTRLQFASVPGGTQVEFAAARSQPGGTQVQFAAARSQPAATQVQFAAVSAREVHPHPVPLPQGEGMVIARLRLQLQGIDSDLVSQVRELERKRAHVRGLQAECARLRAQIAEREQEFARMLES